MDETQKPPTGKRGPLGRLARYGPFAAVAGAAIWLCASFGEPIAKDESHEWRMWIAGAGAALLLLRLLQPLAKGLFGKIAIRAWLAALLSLCVFGAFNYYNFDREEAQGIGDGTDIAYYYLNTKYLQELGYFRLYAAMITADKEHEDRHASRLKRYRDLRDYQVKPVRVALEHGAEIREQRFTPERWEQFKHDVDWFLAFPHFRSLRDYFFADHGYNPPPTWAVPGLALAASVPVERAKWLTLADVVLVLAALAAVAWAFGPEVALWVLLFFVCTFSGRWPMLGQTFLRYDWSSALVIGVCLLKKGKWAMAGAALSYAALNRIFPAIFFFPWLVAALAEWWRTRRIPARHLRLAAGAAVVAVALAAGAVGLFGTEIISESAENLSMHNASYSSHRVGLADLMVWNGELTPEEINADGGMRAKEREVQATRNLRLGIGLVTLVWIGLYIVRARPPLHELIQLAAIPLFCVTTPQINYYNLRMILVLWHGAHLDRSWFHRLGLATLLLVEAATQWSHVQGNARFATTAITSWGLAIYFGVVLLWTGWQVAQSYRRAPAAPLP
ncbi:MAG TPA: hypothetical protein VM285_14230 [Polyangia bacterium]|nr:hypothetical protein [Polyangia bacterium]